MSPETVGLIGVGFLLCLLFTRMWIGWAMSITGFLGLIYLQGLERSLYTIGIVPYETVAMYMMAPIPLFILMGVVVADVGIGEDLFSAANKWLGHMRGGLASATVLASALFAAIVGSSSTGVVIMSKMALPEMRKYRYDDHLATGCIASAGTLGILIPPSMGFILYGILTEQSVGKLFIAGLFPGVLLTVLFLAAVQAMVFLQPNAGPPGDKSSLKEKVASLRGVWPTLLLFIIVLGGIYAGVFTPTEAGAVGAVGAIIISGVRRQLTLHKLRHALEESAVLTAMILFLVMSVYIFLKFITLSNLTVAMADMVNQLGLSRWVTYMGILALYFILGMFMPLAPAVILTIPIVYPIIMTLGFDPIWFGVVVVLMMEMGEISPPVGMNVFILSGISGVPVGAVFRGVWPFVVALLVCLALVSVFPQIALFLPNLMYSG